jgi:hypothetical protein
MRITRARFTTAIAAVAMLLSVPAGAQTSATPADTVAALDTGYVIYDQGVISLPLGVGLRIPSYDRVDGLSLPFGPKIRVPGGRIEIDPTVTYRSNLGAFDPMLAVTARFGRFDALQLSGGRGTFTNDGWIRSDLLNSLAAIGVGSDSRNYFRADRIAGELSHTRESGQWESRFAIGALHERDWSTGLHEPGSRAPWSFLGRKDDLKMRRINPVVARGRLTSGIARALMSYEQAGLKTQLSADVEHAFESPGFLFTDTDASESFTQIVVNAAASFPTFGLQSFAFRGHGVVTPGKNAPPQRFSYLGGAGTLATVDLLALGGDRLLFVEGEYRYPLARPLLPFVGAPVLSARYAAGSAGQGDLPDLIQNIGVAVGLKIVKAEYHIDPNYRKTPFTRKSAFSLGFSLSL